MDIPVDVASAGERGRVPREHQREETGRSFEDRGTVRYLGIEADEAVEIAEKIDS